MGPRAERKIFLQDGGKYFLVHVGSHQQRPGLQAANPRQNDKSINNFMVEPEMRHLELVQL